MRNANVTGDYNDASYVLLFTSPKKGGGTWKFLFAGDSHDDSWEYILENYKDEVSDVDVLFAPHHGRDSDRDYTFLTSSQILDRSKIEDRTFICSFFTALSDLIWRQSTQ